MLQRKERNITRVANQAGTVASSALNLPPHRSAAHTADSMLSTGMTVTSWLSFWEGIWSAEKSRDWAHRDSPIRALTDR